MNSKNIELISNEGYPYFPELSGQKSSRTITKHFTNCAVFLPKEKLSLLFWLVYESRQDNTVIYSTHLLSKYRETIIALQDQYGHEIELSISIQSIRKEFSWLIRNGYLLNNHQKFCYTINFMLTFRHAYISAGEYGQMVKRYQGVQFGTGGDIRDVCEEYKSIINSKIKQK